MGYTTDFIGKFALDEPLTLAQFNTLKDFADERHEYGDYPGYYCQWVPAKDGMSIEWDGNEKFYDYVEWLEYLINHFFEPWGRVLNGKVNWQGEDPNDRGVIVVKDNDVRTVEDTITNAADESAGRVSPDLPPILVRKVESKSKPKSPPYEVRISRKDGRMYCTCFSGETILTSNGTEVQYIQIGDRVDSRSGGTTVIKEIFRVPHVGRVYDIKPLGGLTLHRVTPDHKWWARSRRRNRHHGTGQPTYLYSDPRWVETADLSKCDSLFVPSLTEMSAKSVDMRKFISRQCWKTRLAVKQIVCDDTFARLCGYYVAEGSGSSDYSSFDFGENDSEHVQRLTQIAKTLGYTVNVQNERKMQRVLINSRPLLKLLHRDCGQGAVNKRVPEWILRGSAAVVRAFTKAYLAGDGYLRGGITPVAQTVSNVLALQIQLMLVRFGIWVPIVETAPRQAMINGRTIQGRRSYQIVFSNNVARRFLGVPIQGKRAPQHVRFDDKGVWVPIRKIVACKFKGDVFDVKTETGDFLAQNFASHNCKGWQMRKDCTHLQKTTKEHILAALEKASDEGGIGI